MCIDEDDDYGDNCDEGNDCVWYAQKTLVPTYINFLINHPFMFLLMILGLTHSVHVYDSIYDAK